MVTIHDVKQGDEVWHELRSGKYTGQNADKLLAYSASIKVVNGVASSYALTEITGFSGNFFTRRGHYLEDEALELYAEITGHTVSRPGFVTNDQYPDCGYSPDGHDDELEIPLEVKAFEREKHLKMYRGDIPMKIRAQIHFGQFIWEKKGARLLIYNPELDPKQAFKIIDIPYNQNIQNNFKRILGKEVAHV